MPLIYVVMCSMSIWHSKPNTLKSAVRLLTYAVQCSAHFNIYSSISNVRGTYFYYLWLAQRTSYVVHIALFDVDDVCYLENTTDVDDTK